MNQAKRRITHARYESELAQIIRLHVVKRKTPAEISEETGVRLGLVKRRLNDSGYSVVRLRPVDNKPLGSDGRDFSLPSPDLDDAYVSALIAHGGLPRLSEKLTRQGHVACLPLIPYGARP